MPGADWAVRPVPPTGLPIEDCLPALSVALAQPGQAVLAGPPGSGKTTVVPLRLLDAPWLAGQRIVMLEPRRLATRAAARRMAFLAGEEVGATIGYRTCDERRTGPQTRIEVVTEGILTRRLQRDPSLPGTGLVIFDEFHERNLQADLGLALLLDVIGGHHRAPGHRPALRPDLRLLAMSATLDTARVATLLGGEGGPAPVIGTGGRAHPVDIRWLPRKPKDRLAPAATAAVLRALREESGDVLVFLPGAADIRRVETALRSDARLPPEVDVRPLFGALSIAEQDAALAPSPPGRRRVVLATDIAETSLTVEGVRVVVDGGQARSPRYDPGRGLTRLQTGSTSRASADQRAGRAGRTEPGVAYRLWSKMEHAARRPFPDPEIASVDLAGLALELAVWGAEPARLAFLDRPPARALQEAGRLLSDLGALDDSGRPTAEGRAMAELPLHPRLARMVTGAAPLGLGWTACVLAALLEDRDVLRGAPDEVPVDVAERVRLVADRNARHPRADPPAVQGARRRAGDLARRVGVEPGAAEPARAGLALSLAYPDRIGQGRGRGRFRLRNGAGAWVPAGDPMAAEAFVVVAEMDFDRRDSRVRLASALEAADIESAAGAGIERSVTLAWDPARDDLRLREERRLDGLVLGEGEGPADPGPATTRALLERVRATRLGVLRFEDAARALQQRVAFARRVRSDAGWPDLSDAGLLGSLDEWLAPRLAKATGRADLEAVDVAGALRARLGPVLVAELERLAPPMLALPSGRRVPIDYGGDQPVAAVRVQELFGVTRHPAVGGGAVPVVLQLLSPAGRPVQVTADLPGFWSGSWAEVRKEMAGRYPKHPWPADPTTAEPRRPG